MTITDNGVSASTAQRTSVFAKHQKKNYPFNYQCSIFIDALAGGTPTNPKTVEGWLRTKLGEETDDIIRGAVVDVMAERGISAEEATAVVAENKTLCGFKRDEHGLYLEGRQVKACLKEAAMVAVAAGKLPAKWGTTRKGLKSFCAEHVFVDQDRIYLGRQEADGITTRFIHKYTGSAIQTEEFCKEVELSFSVESDYEFSEAEWAALWLTAERQGVGASRSQGMGRFTVTRWTRID